MKTNNTYWRGSEELNQTPEFIEKANAEFPGFLPMSESNASEGEAEDNSRRDFLKLMGFGFAAATLIACETPVRKIIPYVNKPIEIEPGRANYYASSYISGSEYASIVVKTREGRPIKIEGNPMSSVTRGGVNTRIHASILNLYDIARAKNFTKQGEKIARSKADKEIVKGLQGANKIAVVAESVLSPSLNSALVEFGTAFPAAEVIKYDAVSYSGVVEANGGVFPTYDFEKADVVVGFGADFLSTWGPSIEYSKGYGKQRKVRRGKNAKSSMNKHYQFEASFSLTGANADIRVAVKPSEEPFYITALYNAVASATGASQISGAKAVTNKDAVTKVAKDLLAAKGKSLVVSGSNDVSVQTIVAEINAILGNVGNTVDLDNANLSYQGNDANMNAFVKNVASYDAVIFLESNPVYNHAQGAALAAGLAKVKMSVAISDRLDETGAIATYHTPSLHGFETWGDAQPRKGNFSIGQPTITPIFENAKYGYENRAAIESILTWAGNTSSAYDYVRKYWEANIYTDAAKAKYTSFDTFWTEVLKTGVVDLVSASTSEESTGASTEEVSFEGQDVQSAYSAVATTYGKASGVELILSANASVGTGTGANNPWLQEVPDPMTKVCWDNYVAVSPIDMRESSLVEGGLEQGDVVKISLNGAEALLPVVEQPGQKAGTIAVALGYGRTAAGQLASGLNAEHKVNAEGTVAIGSDVYDFVTTVNGTQAYAISGVAIEKSGSTRRIAQTQTHHTIMGRDIVREASLSDYQKGEEKFGKQMEDRYQVFIASSNGAQKPNEVDIWAEDEAHKAQNPDSKEMVTHVYPNHHWGMVVDMNACIGCGSCIVSCQAENNIPVVGKDEVIRRREMHWMRIDRYYSSVPEEEMTEMELDASKWSVSGNKNLEKASDYPQRVTFQPIMCQHCNHATCETVCPVMATTHSSEGLNQMTYNRCIGTRYCANNCAYKVRRFNWFNYSDSRDTGREFMGVNTAMNDDLGKMVLNPDVMVRARGVIEKCSMCVQRIQSGKLDAKLNKETVQDGAIETACSSSCPSDCITFGDMNDPKSKISKILAEEAVDRKFHVLEELNVKPNVTYLTKIRNI